MRLLGCSAREHWIVDTLCGGCHFAWTLLVVTRVTAISCGSNSQPSGMFVVHGLFIGTVVWTDCYQSVIVVSVFNLHACTFPFFHGPHGCLFDLSSWCERRFYVYSFVHSCSCGLPCGFLPLAGSIAYPWTYIELYCCPRCPLSWALGKVK